MAESIAHRYRSFYAAMEFGERARYPLVHPAFRTSFVLSAGVIDMRRIIEGLRPDTDKCILIQPCFRHYDADAVCTGRHLSLFEMAAALYFDPPHAQSIVGQVLKFLIDEVGLCAERLWLTAFAGGSVGCHTFPSEDDSTLAWTEAGLSPARIRRLGIEDNFWQEGASSGERRSGLCGPHAEVFIERMRSHPCVEASCRPGCGCGKFIEIANIVFPRFILQNGNCVPLQRSLAEAAVGLDRVTMVRESASSIFHVSHLARLTSAAMAGPLQAIESRSDALVVLDHIRSFCCLMAEGGVPSGRGRGHILRRLVRNSLAKWGGRTTEAERGVLATASLVREHPEACCGIDVSGNWQRIHRLLEAEVQRFESPMKYE